MKKILFASALLTLVGCGSTQASYVKSPDTTLGRVVVYRNGVAYFERVAQVEGDSLKLQVPADKVDDFLKSLTVVDAKTGAPAPVAYPTNAPSNATGLIDMKITLSGPSPHRLRLSYVTEAPSWKPSYRFVVGKSGKVNVQGWAIVDNTSGEDWNGIKLGVGSSSAMSFRFDLRSVRTVERETLQSNDLFALAPPTGASTYGKDERRVVGDLDDGALAMNEEPAADPAPTTPGAQAAPPARNTPPPAKSAHKRPADAPMSGGAAGGTTAGQGFGQMARSLASSPNQIVIEGFATKEDGDKYAASLERANRARDQLVRNGVDASKVVAVGRGEQPGRAGGVRVVEARTPAQENAKKPDGQAATGTTAPPLSQDPIGAAHFESQAAMNVPRGTSAMVSILNTDTDGEIVYLYDAESPRGNATFPFRAVRVKNPTDSVLESGPVTVFGDGKFIGEGLSEPIPARSVAFVPFALDRQVVVESKEGERDEISRILTVTRGVFSTEVKHTRSKTFTLHNRTGERASVFIRHTVAGGYSLTKSPAGTCQTGECEKIGGAHLFKVDVDPKKSQEVTLEEETPVFKSTDIRTPAGLDMVKVFLSSNAARGPLKEKVAELVRLHGEMAKIEQQIATTREQMQEYRVRMDELHAQIVTLKVVKSAGPLMVSLEGKMREISDRTSKATIDLVGLQEKQMIARIHFQDGIAELTLEKDASVAAK